MKWARALPEQYEVTWPELVEFLVDVQPTDQPKSTERDGDMVSSLPCWVPAKLRDPTLQKGRRTNKNVESVSVLVLDFDKLKVAQWQEALSRLQGLSWAYHSTFSHRPISGALCYRVVVELDRPVPGHQWKKFFKVMAEELGGVNDDSCCDPARLFYAPFCPADGPAPESGSFEGAALPVDYILSSLNSAPSAVAKVLGGKDLTHAAICAIVPNKYKTIDNELVVKGYTGLVSALGGEPFAERGERHSVLLSISGILARAFPGYTPEQIAAPLMHILDHEDDRIPASQALLTMVEKDLEKNLEATQERDNSQLVGRENGYTLDEVDEYVRRLKLNSREALARQLLIAVGADYYVFNEGDYIYLGSKERAELHVYSRLAAVTATLPVTLGEETKTGYQYKSLKTLFQQYGRPALKINKDLRIQQSFLERDTFNYAVCKRDPELRPKYSPAADVMLQSTSDQQGLQDWLATCAKLEQSTAGLVLDGKKMTGKSTIAKGVARIYNNRYTPMHQLTAAFNDGLARCPVVYAEETVPWDFRRDTGLLKELITADSQQLKVKFQDSADLIGSVRVIIAKNDHKLFEAGEALTQNTVDALCDRILYVHMGDAPAPYIPAKEMAEHILWLEANRTVGQSSRGGMWVTGKPTRLHYRMRAFTSKVAISVCQWLLNFIESPHLCGDTAGARFRLDSQGLQVQSKLIYDKWEPYASKECRQPTMAQVAEALGGISERSGTLNRVDLDVLAEYADFVGYTHDTKEALQGAIERAGVVMVQKGLN